VICGQDGVSLVCRLVPASDVICLQRRLRLNWSDWRGNWMRCCDA